MELEYNIQGNLLKRKDQNGTIHEYVLDKAGRKLHDRVTTVGGGVDNAVLRTSTTYDIRSLVEKITSYDNATVGSGNVVNEVVFEYDDLGNLAKEYQEHSGAKDANTLYVQYNRDTTASSDVFTKGLRPTSTRYPNGRLVHTTYGTSGEMNDVVNRPAAINDDNSGSPGDAVSEYTYLGGGRIVKEDYPQPDVRLDYDSGTAGEYAGFDRFGRVVDQLWRDYGASADRDRYGYGYDRVSSRTYRENTTASGKDEFYTYDGVNQLKTFDRGDLNQDKTAISGTPGREEDWTLDMTGNWSQFVQKTAGSTDLDQTRGHNKVNEVTSASSWATPAHDRNGNMTTIPKPSSLANGLTATYDAWNRLVEVADGQTIVGHYEYDGLNRRIKKGVDSESPANPNGIDGYVHYFYSAGWQVVETRETTTENDQAESLQPKHQYVWSKRYIDAAVLRDENTDQDSLCDDGRIYYLNDANFNVTALVDTSGDVLERYSYSPYGAVSFCDAAWSNTYGSSYANATLYTGREFDPETGLYQYRNRYYSAELGRFVSRDPIGYRGGLNLYEYVGDSPTNDTDATGEARSNSQRECTFGLYDGDDPGGRGGKVAGGVHFKCGAEAVVGKENAVGTHGRGVDPVIGRAFIRDCCIKELHIFDHGCVGQQHAGGPLTQSDVNALCNSLCDNARIQLWGCLAGAGDPSNPASILYKLLHCPKVKSVKACTNLVVYQGKMADGRCCPGKPECTGEWRDFPPSPPKKPWLPFVPIFTGPRLPIYY